MPPFDVPSSLVRQSAVIGTTSANAFACTSAFWPVVASRTSITSSGPSGTLRSMTRRILPSSSMRLNFVCRRPAVSMRTTSALAALGGGHRVEDDGAGVGALLVRDDVGADDLAPGLELLDGGGAERVGGGDDDLLAVLAVGLRELGDARRLAGAVDADDEDDGGRPSRRRVLLAPDAALLAAGLEDADQLFLEEIADRVGVLDALLLDAGAARRRGSSASSRRRCRRR